MFYGKAGHTLPLINQSDRLHILFLMKDATMKGGEWLLLELGHSFPLKDLIDSLRYKNRPAVHYIILCTHALLLFTNASPNLTGSEVNLRGKWGGGHAAGTREGVYFRQIT